MTNRNIIFQNFDAALDELKQRLYNGEHYKTPNSCVNVSYNLEIHGFQTFASSLCNGTSTGEDGTSEYSTTIKIIQIKTNQEEFEEYIDKRFIQDLLENLSKEECRKLLIDYLVHLGLEKIQSNPLDIAAKYEMQSKDVNCFINKLQYKPQKVDDLRLLLAGWYHIPPAIARLVAKNIIEDKNMEIYADNTGQKWIKLKSTLLK
jgi:hypothetical protein